MFGANAGGNSLFGSNLSTSTPTSTPTPATNAFQPRPKPGGGLFSNVNSTNNNAVSSPTPSGGLFGNGNTTNANNTTSGGLFGNNKPASTSNSLFGGNSNANGGGNTATGGLFGSNNTSNNNNNNNKATTDTAGGMFGNTSNTGISNQAPLNSTGGLFGNSNNNNNTTTTPANASSGLFSKTNNSNNTPMSNSLFGNKPPVAGTNSTSLFGTGSATGNSASTGLFNSKPANSLFNNTTQQTNSGSLFGNREQQQQQQQQVASLSDNPYGLQIGSLPVNISSMPESITTSLKKKKPTNREAFNLERKRTLSTSSTGNGVSFAPQAQPTLISKLSSRLNSVKSVETTHGLFSPSHKALAFKGNVASERSSEPSLKNSLNKLTFGGLTNLTPLVKRNDISEMRKLKIDTKRSAAKKLKLLDGKSSTTKVKILGDSKNERETTPESYIFTRSGEEQLSDPETHVPDQSENEQNKNTDYWCSPSIEQLLQLPVKQLSAVSNFVIGRKGYGSVAFDYDVDLTAFADDLENYLFDNIVIFNDNKTVEVYPDESVKPSVGYGLNVPATITLERVYAIDRKTKEPIIDNSKLTEVQLFVRKLKKLRDMEFISYNPFGGIWIFKVKHFSIWGLLNDEDIEVDEEEAETARREEIRQRAIAMPKRRANQTQGDEGIPGAFNQIVHIPQDDKMEMFDSAHNSFALQQGNFNDEEIENSELPEMIEERQYEPSDVDEEDFMGLESEPNLDVSNNWLEQLKLSGSSCNSVFAFSNALVKSQPNNVDDMLFGSLKKKMELYKTVKKQMRLDSTINVAKFNMDSTLLVKGGSSDSGFFKQVLESSLQKNKSSIDNLFKKYLSNSIISKRETNGYPAIKQLPLKFEDIADAYKNVSQEQKVWELASILFDSMSIPYKVEKKDVESVLIKKQRHQKLCKWIVSQISDEINSKLDLTPEVNEKIFLHLAINDIVGATKLSIESGNGHLAILVTLLGSNDPRVRDLASLQLSKWKAIGAKVDSSIIKIYQLLTGCPFDSKCLIDVSCQFSWLVNLGLQLFYGDIDGYTLEKLVQDFFENPHIGTNPEAHDITSCILRLFANKGRSETIFGNLKLLGISTDVRLPWFFIQILKSNGDYKFSDDLCDRVTLQFVEQLKINQMFNEALFTLSFLNSDYAAKKQADLLISTEINFFAKPSNEQVLQRLNIPPKIVYQALALSDKYNNDYLSETRNLLKAECFSLAEQVIVSKVAPSLIIKSSENEEGLNTLRQLLSVFPAYEMKNWEKSLGVFDCYLKFILDKDTSRTLMEKLVQGLPILYGEQTDSNNLPVCCSLMSEKVCSVFLKKFKDAVSVQSTKDKLLELPLGQPERVYLESILSGF